MNIRRDDRSPIAIALSWASQAMAVAMEMALPGLVGYWLDGRLDTGVLLTLCGVGLGFAMGTWHLVYLTRAMNRGDANQRDDASLRNEDADVDN